VKAVDRIKKEAGVYNELEYVRSKDVEKYQEIKV